METNRSGRRTEYRRAEAYTYGSVARQVEVAPQRRSEYEQRPQRQQKVKTMSFTQVVFLVMATLVTIFVLVNYIQLRSEMENRIVAIRELELELKDAKAENDADYNDIMLKVNLEEIRRVAIEELGMTYATSEQVVEYESEESDYVRQYESIPEEESKGW